ncbi:hypothetical protein [Streptomyces sirii]|uniref:hypothetical protein n=1 Tax=Streptomyces sirii TaxID=3127701 RepID=UPI003D35B20D
MELGGGALRRGLGGAAVGERTDHAAGRVGDGRAHVQRTARRRRRTGTVRLRRGGGLGNADGAEVDRTGVPAAALVVTGLGGHRLEAGGRLRGGVERCRVLGLRGRALVRLLRQRRRLLAPGALGTRHQQQVVVLDDAVGLVDVGVFTRRGHHARQLRRSGVGRGRSGRGLRLPGMSACVLRQSLARDLAGVGHAYPSPIGSAPSNRSCDALDRDAPTPR